MVAVLVDSRRNGRTAWIATRGLEAISVSGIARCEVAISCKGGVSPEFLVQADGEYDLPPGTELVSVEHRNATEESRVFVDLIRGRNGSPAAS